MSEKRTYVVTSKGNAELNGASNALDPAELKLLVLVDGMASVGEIARNPQHGIDAATVPTLLDKLARRGYIADPDGTSAINIGDFFKESELGAASLQANGFFVRIARPPTELAKNQKQKVTVMAIEDDPALAKLLRTYLQMEGCTVRVAATREEINKALREPPKPDIVLLDVMLPDSDGFDLLEKMRHHEFLKGVPIIMATAKATREAVLKGLQRGADGYVTKPYDMEVLYKAIRTVLGLKSSPA